MQKYRRHTPWLWFMLLILLVSLAACRQRALQETTPITIPLDPGVEGQPLEIPTPLPGTATDVAPAGGDASGYPAPTTEAVPPAGYPAPTLESQPADSGDAGEQPADSGATPPEPTQPPQDIVYVIQAGDTIGEIAQRYGVTIDAIALANNLANINSIQVGDSIIIPLSGNISATPPQERSHTVAFGETLFSIARLYGVDLNELAAYNGIGDPTLIYAGQVLRIPPPAATQP